MKKNRLKLKMLFFVALATSCTSQLTAVSQEEFLADVGKRFSAAPSKEAKREIVTERLDIRDLARAETLGAFYKTRGQKSQAEESKRGVERELALVNVTHPLMMAIVSADYLRFSTFLEVIDDVKDVSLCTWGYRQPYTLAHMALDPQDTTHVDKSKGSLTDRLRILDLLGSKGADFNQRVPPKSVGVYENPPLVAAGLNYVLSYTDELRARALLYGADPVVNGSSKTLLTINPTPNHPRDSFGREAERLCFMAFNEYYASLRRPKEGQRLAPSVRERMKTLLAETLESLQDEEEKS